MAYQKYFSKETQNVGTQCNFDFGYVVNFVEDLENINFFDINVQELF